MPNRLEAASRWEVQNSPLFKYATKPTSEVLGREPTRDPDGGEYRNLGQGELNEIQPAGLKLLRKFAEDYEDDLGDDGKPKASAAAAKKYTDAEKSILLGMVKHFPHLFEVHARTAQILARELDLPVESIPVINGQHPVDEGEFPLIDRWVSRHRPNEMGTYGITELPGLLDAELRGRRREIQGDRTGALTMSLFRDYTTALWSQGEQPLTHMVGKELVDTLRKTPAGERLAGKNYNGAPWGMATSLALGLDPNAFETKFPKARILDHDHITFLSMDGEMSGPMKHLDKYLKAKGRETGAEKLELASPLNWIIGEEAGHKKAGNLEEARPFSSSGVNWGLAMFPNRRREFENLPLTKGKEFPIDCLDGFQRFITCIPARGERLVIKDKEGRDVEAKLVVVKRSGKAVSWHAEFKRGRENLKPEDVVGRIADRYGNLKGDGKVEGEVDMWWWGFCDRYTGQGTFKAMYDIPQLDVDQVKVKVGRSTVTVPKADAQKLIDADINDIVTGHIQCGFRFDNENATIALKNGEQLQGRIGADIFEHALFSRLEGDTAIIHDSPGKPILGTIAVETEWGGTEQVHVRNIESISRKANDNSQTPKVVIKIKNGDYEDTLEGKLVSKVRDNLWERSGDDMVAKQTKAMAIRGDIEIDLGGEKRRVPASDVLQIEGETSRDMRISSFIRFVQKTKGVFATDGDPEEVVSNGSRCVNFLDQDEHTKFAERPEWAPQGELHGMDGALTAADFKEGDKLTWIRGLMQHGDYGDGETFTGWIHTRNGVIMNEAILEGVPDFCWSADPEAELNWKAPSSFNRFMDPELRIALMVNGVKDMNDELAKRLHLPENWRTYKA
jgi:hypothetical protein